MTTSTAAISSYKDARSAIEALLTRISRKAKELKDDLAMTFKLANSGVAEEVRKTLDKLHAVVKPEGKLAGEVSSLIEAERAKWNSDTPPEVFSLSLTEPFKEDLAEPELRANLDASLPFELNPQTGKFIFPRQLSYGDKSVGIWGGGMTSDITDKFYDASSQEIEEFLKGIFDKYLDIKLAPELFNLDDLDGMKTALGGLADEIYGVVSSTGDLHVSYEPLRLFEYVLQLIGKKHDESKKTLTGRLAFIRADAKHTGAFRDFIRSEYYGQCDPQIYSNFVFIDLDSEYDKLCSLHDKNNEAEAA